MNYESLLYMCDCNDCSSHVNIEWHSPYCEYRKWRIERAAQHSAQRTGGNVPQKSDVEGELVARAMEKIISPTRN